ncbi:MAG: hypothetical protein H7A33_07710 [Deltaproteobacteria bacterium]|nr:hypothetical protein [Deltaproteobacteria bacterium]
MTQSYHQRIKFQDGTYQISQSDPNFLVFQRSPMHRKMSGMLFFFLAASSLYSCWVTHSHGYFLEFWFSVFLVVLFLILMSVFRFGHRVICFDREQKQLRIQFRFGNWLYRERVFDLKIYRPHVAMFPGGLLNRDHEVVVLDKQGKKMVSFPRFMVQENAQATVNLIKNYVEIES